MLFELVFNLSAISHTSFYFIHSILGVIEYQKRQIYIKLNHRFSKHVPNNISKQLCVKVKCDYTIFVSYVVCFCL